MTDRSICFDPGEPPPEDPQAKLERSFIEAFLKTKGYSIKDLPHLPADVAKKLMIEACTYASNKLAEVETRSRLVGELHGQFP
jgi:hypothetical protein